MSNTTEKNHEEPDSQTIEFPPLPPTLVCPVCGATSNGFTNCLHTQTERGDEVRCLECYRAFVQSEIHLKTIQDNIPQLIPITDASSSV